MQALDHYVADRISPHQALTPEGYLILMGMPIARTGVQTYRADEVDKDGTLGLTGLVDIHRPAEEVFAPAAVMSFEGKSVVSPHPPQFLTADNDMLYSKGHVQQVRAGRHPETGAPVLLADLVIKDASLRQMIKDGHRVEISGGYTYDLDHADDPHSPNAKMVQRNIRGNHVAIVASGRAGSDIRVLDSAPESPERKAEMPEPVATTTVGEAEKLGGVGFFSQLTTFLKEMGLKLTPSSSRSVEATDGESEAVERNRKVNAKANSLRLRVADGEMEEEEKGAKEPDDEDEKEDEKMEGGKKKEFKAKGEDRMTATDARELRDSIRALATVVSRATAQDEGKCICDGEGTCEHCKSKEGEDADLIPVATLKGDEIPQNPIPGADAALAELRKMRPFVAKSGNREAIDSYNAAVSKLKRGVASEDNGGGYGDLVSGRKKPDAVAEGEARIHVGARDAQETLEDKRADFEGMAKQFHRQNPSGVKVEHSKKVN